TPTTVGVNVWPWPARSPAKPVTSSAAEVVISAPSPLLSVSRFSSTTSTPSRPPAAPSTAANANVRTPATFWRRSRSMPTNRPIASARARRASVGTGGHVERSAPMPVLYARAGGRPSRCGQGNRPHGRLDPCGPPARSRCPWCCPRRDAESAPDRFHHRVGGVHDRGGERRRRRLRGRGAAGPRRRRPGRHLGVAVPGPPRVRRPPPRPSGALALVPAAGRGAGLDLPLEPEPEQSALPRPLPCER